MQKIWIVNQFANTPDLPGHTRQYDIAKFLVKNKWDVEIFASDFNLSKRTYTKLKNNHIIKSEFPEGIKWHWLWASPYKKNNWKRYINLISFCVHLFLRLSFLLINKNKKNPDIILASSPQLPAAYFCLLLAKLFQKPFVLEVRDLWPQVLIDQKDSGKYSFFIKILLFMERKVYEGSEIVIVLAKGSEKFVKKRGAKRTIWLPNGPDLTIFKKVPLIPEEEVFSNKRPFKLLYAGAHGEANNLFNILSAAKILQNYPIKFVFIGNGTEKKRLVAEAKYFKNVIFKDPIPKNQMPILISKFDAVIVSLKDTPLFRYGVSPNKLYDAYAVGRPVVTTINGDVNEEVKEYNLGVTAPPEDPQELAKSLKKLFSSTREERENMAKRSREIAEKIYSRQIINQKFNKIMLSII